MTPTNRKDAAIAGQTYYNTGRPCRAGHFADRYTSTGNCRECLKLASGKFNAVLREQRRPMADGSALFNYRLHPADHAAALAYCQALDMNRGRAPSPRQAVDAAAALRPATPQEAAGHRSAVLQRLGAELPPEAPRRGLAPEMAATLRAYGIRSDER